MNHEYITSLLFMIVDIFKNHLLLLADHSDLIISFLITSGYKKYEGLQLDKSITKK